MSSTRRRSHAASVDMSRLSKLDRLIMAQAVWEIGAEWTAIAKILSKHPLLAHPKSFFTPQSCAAMYSYLIKDAELEFSQESNEPKADVNLKLAKHQYLARYQELRDDISAEEAKFKRILAEIEDIRSGSWDDKIRADISGVPDEEVKETVISIPEATTEEMPVPEINRTATTSTLPMELDIPVEDDTVSLEVPLVSTEDDVSDAPPRENSPKLLQELTEAPLHDLTSLSAKPAEPDVVQTAEVSHQPVEGYESEPHSPPEVIDVDTAAEEPEGTPQGADLEEDGSTSGDEPLQATRKSTRRQRPSATAAAQAKTAKSRRQRRGTSVPEDGDALLEADIEMVATPQEDQADSPSADAVTTRRSKRKASNPEQSDGLRDRKRLREPSEPDDDEPGPSSARTRRRGDRTEEQVALKRFQNVIGMLHSQISQHRSGNIFHNPIKASEAPDYRDIVKRPVDLKTIKARIKDGVICNSLEYQRDIYLMFANAMMYNRPGSDIYSMTEDMMYESEVMINTHRQTEGYLSNRKTH
ncbi:uncharacterized protein BT62DRAFT_1073683 [Guyanagaster necrorhizus]|uniref:Bromo domain-containing protein n=1 Tax=Guyanagaster necrorhizus TaxID=856835 RepID=A0A9P8AWR0_9AGAR|nr:uncharacterized protein BT62DRAFT_1073683 [Guyanagaster necrorhizus MCA 3950]KAG7449167.1 hypothetical protein BT62DRAFT_1073683 [Guyanagaster necrorhizus MCA 3950]